MAYTKATRDLWAGRVSQPVQTTLFLTSLVTAGTICVPAADQQFFLTFLCVAGIGGAASGVVREGIAATPGTVTCVGVATNTHGSPLRPPQNDPIVFGVGLLPTVSIGAVGTAVVLAKGYLESGASA